MNPISHEYIRFVRSRDVATWISYHEDDQCWHTCTYVRGKRGVYCHTDVYGGDQPSVARVARHARARGRFSTRPCRMGQYFDSSMTHGAIALLCHWCACNHVDVRPLLLRMFGDEAPQTQTEFDDIAAQADWEGIVYPTYWNESLSHELCTALLEVGYVPLAAIFAKGLASAS